MDLRILIPVIVVAAAMIAIAVILILRNRRRTHLKQQFGPEYDRALAEHGDARKADLVLLEREKRVKAFSLRPLTPSDRERYAEDWAAIQRRFVDDPSNSVNQADTLVNTVLVARGYPVGDFEQRAADISVNYPSLVQNYRSAREVMIRHSQSHSSTEDLRLAMVNFRSLFDELLESPSSHREPVEQRLAS